MKRFVIGDCHGHLKSLQSLLAKLKIHGNRIPAGVELYFLGDLLDRGPDSAAVVSLVRSLCDTGRAHCLLANHEFNFVNYNTETSAGSGEFRRPHSEKNMREVAETFASYRRSYDDPETALASDIAWFKQLPIALEMDQLRLVHACWHPAHLASFQRRGSGWYLEDSHWDEAWKKGTPCFESAEVLCKGLEAQLPDGITFKDKGGNERSRARVCWWKRTPLRWEDYIRAPGIDFTQLPDGVTLPQSDLAPVQPTLFGHYWFTGRPTLISKYAACLDFSVAAKSGGYLCAYEHHPGETKLRPSRLHWVYRNLD